MAELFSLVNYFNLPIYMYVYLYIHIYIYIYLYMYIYTIIAHNNYNMLINHLI